MNIYEKINAIRLELSNNKEIKKTGKNKFAGFEYYQLQDFMPLVIKRMNELGLFSKFDLTDDDATLTICDYDGNEVKFTSPTATLELKGCNSVQEVGGTHTYLKRYLYINAFEITEPDLFEAVSGKSDVPHKEVKKITVNANFEAARQDNIDYINTNIDKLIEEARSKYENWFGAKYKKEAKELTYEQSVEAKKVLEKGLGIK